MKPKADPTDTYASPEAIPRTPEELLESMTGMFLPPSAMGEVNGLKILCLQRENTSLKAEVERLLKERNLEHDACNNYLHILDDRKAEVERLRGQLQQAVEIAEVFESELDEYHSVDRNCPDAAWHYPYGWERSEDAKDKLESLNREIK